MEKQPKVDELLSYKDRQRLIKNILAVADIYQAQLVAASPRVRGNYIPILSSTRLMLETGLTNPERAHLRRVIATQVDVLQVADREVSSLSEFRESIESVAGPEIVQWRDIQERQEPVSKEWRYAYNDAKKIAESVSETLEQQ